MQSLACIKAFMFSMADPAQPSAFNAFTRALISEKPATSYDYGLISMEFEVGDQLASTSIPSKSH